MPRSPDERCDDLYETGIARSLDGWADAVLVADADGEPAGYVSLHAGTDAGSIGLIGVKPEKRSRGLGHELVRGAVRWSAEHSRQMVTVATQGRNIAALRTFESCGFRTTDVRALVPQVVRPVSGEGDDVLQAVTAS